MTTGNIQNVELQVMNRLGTSSRYSPNPEAEAVGSQTWTREIIAVVPAVASQKTTGVVLGVGGDEKVRHHPSTFATPFQLGAKHGSSQESAGLGRGGEG